MSIDRVDSLKKVEKGNLVNRIIRLIKFFFFENLKKKL